MCVILTAAAAKLTACTIDRAFDHNPDGAGFAWLEGSRVRWAKGLDRDAVQELAATRPTPYIAHFRIASVGPVGPDLCHPFPVGGALALEGRRRGPVVFHNGTWGDWRPSLLRSALATGRRVPEGPWSDTRVMAWLAQAHGVEFLRHLAVQARQKIAVLDAARGIERFGDWEDLGRGQWASNLYWRRQERSYVIPPGQGGGWFADDDEAAS